MKFTKISAIPSRGSAIDNEHAIVTERVVPRAQEVEVIDLLDDDDPPAAQPAAAAASSSSAEAETINKCLICDASLAECSEEAKEQHTARCLDDMGSQQCGLREKEFYCVLCDMDLSRRKLLSRCWHLKSCVRNHAMTTKQLLQLIAPVQEIDSSSSDEEVEVIPEPAAKAPRDALSVLMQASKQQHQLRGFQPIAKTKAPTAATSAPAASRKRTQGDVAKAAKVPKWAPKAQAYASHPGYAPAYKKIQPGNMAVPIVVDGFQYACSALTDTYFLSHFHSDHYQGLSKDFDCGKIYTSIVTASLVKLKLKVSSAFLVALEMETKYVLSVGGEDVEVTLTDANHCPGAVCFVFHFLSSKRTVLHTGDFRYHEEVMLRASPALRQLAHPNGVNDHLTVYLDTTYCSAAYAFPPQQTVIDAVVAALIEESRQPGTLFVFGAYTIGKERIFMAAAAALGKKVHVDKTRWKSMLCYNWSLEEQAMLTTDPAASNIWVVSLHQVNFNALPGLLAKSGCRRVVAVQPTGWTHSSQPAPVTDIGGISVRRKGDNMVIYAAPYSEHSSFKEMVQFIQTFKPFRVVPTVNTQVEKVQEQLQLLRNASGVYDKV